MLGWEEVLAGVHVGNAKFTLHYFPSRQIAIPFICKGYRVHCLQLSVANFALLGKSVDQFKMNLHCSHALALLKFCYRTLQYTDIWLYFHSLSMWSAPTSQRLLPFCAIFLPPYLRVIKVLNIALLKSSSCNSVIVTTIDRSVYQMKTEVQRKQTVQERQRRVSL